MFTPRTILVIQAHPDDAEIFCAGTLALLREKGHRIVITTITSGGMGGIGMDVEATAATRKAEAAEAAGLIESEYHCLDQRDGFL
jgi:LmbE family N-acetylglucosaminyl deacetylase